MASLILEHNSAVLKNYPLAKRSLTIGRNVNNTIVLDDQLVSGYHARIDKRGVDYILTDLQSTNGTFLNDVNIVSRILSHGDKIMIGEHAILFIGTEMAKAYEEEKKLDLNKTTIRGVSKKRRTPSNQKTIERSEISAIEVKRSRLVGRLAPILLSIFILTIGGWYILNYEPILLKSVFSITTRTSGNDTKENSANMTLSKSRSAEAESMSLMTQAQQKSIPRPAKESSDPFLSEENLFMPISTETEYEEPSSKQSWEESEGFGQSITNEIDEPRYILEGIVWASESKDSFAVINGQIVRAGGSVKGIKIVEIGKRFVIIQDSKDDSKIRLTLR
jgi:pSer/pThr/pTyr-binding forkhead associated (FHA) protein